MEAASLLAILGICSFQDVKRKQVEVFSLLAFGVLGFVFHMLYTRLDILSILGGMFVGVGLFAISVLSSGKIGKGDALIVTITGIYLGFWGNLILLWGAALMASLAGMYSIIGNKKYREIPFAPFLLAMYLILLVFAGL